MTRSDHTYTLIQALNFSPPIGSKARKFYSSIQTEKFNRDVMSERGFSLDNPIWSAIGNLVEAVTNIPLGRLSNKMINLDNAFDSTHEFWKRTALLMGWNMWDLGLEDPDLRIVKEEIRETKKEEKKEKKKIKKQEKEAEKQQEDSVLENQYQKDQNTERANNKKDIKCSAVVNGRRCNNKVEGRNTKCTIHEPTEKRSDNERVRCSSIKSNGERCKMKTGNKSGKCYYHD